jgi:hypothetical protein
MRIDNLNREVFAEIRVIWDRSPRCSDARPQQSKSARVAAQICGTRNREWGSSRGFAAKNR